MSTEGNVRVMTTHRLLEMKQKGEKIAMLTAYDFTSARILDEAGIDIILVGDSAANVMAGHETTLPITIDQMIYHAQSVMRAVKNPLVVVDMPFGSYQGNSKMAVSNAPSPYISSGPMRSGQRKRPRRPNCCRTPSPLKTRDASRWYWRRYRRLWARKWLRH